jgi:phosphatidylserine/phosphatidylglycerophosphate/cardiolipin synthase-like enzyme
MKNFIFTLLKVTFISLIYSLSIQAKVYDFTEDNKLTLLQDTKAAVDYKINLIKHAKHHIHIMSYYWDDNGYSLEMMQELKNANNRGVEVRIITTFLPTLAMDFWGKAKKILYADYDKKNPKAVLSLESLNPGIHESWTNNIHEKVFLVDAEKAIVGGRNISESSRRAKDLEMILEGSVVNQVQEHFRKMFSFLVELRVGPICHNFSNCLIKNYKSKFDEGSKKYFHDQPRYSFGARARVLTNELLFNKLKVGYSGTQKFEMKDDIIDTIIKINFTKMRGYNYFIIPTERYKNFLLKNLAEGKSITLMTNSYKSASFLNASGYLYGIEEMADLVAHGLNLHQWLGVNKENTPEGKELSYLHEKVMLFDDDHGFIGSHNFGAGSTAVSSEISIEFFSNSIVKVLNDIFDSEVEDGTVSMNTTIPMLENEAQFHTKRIRILNSIFMRNIIRELY